MQQNVHSELNFCCINQKIIWSIKKCVCPYLNRDLIDSMYKFFLSVYLYILLRLRYATV